ncbi:MAG: glycosyltransferase, partial [Firmicutes bacterium]|nr:glycosyltransferase [Bacillota bacterium]
MEIAALNVLHQYWIYSLSAICLVLIIAIISWKYPRREWPYKLLTLLALTISAIYLIWRVDATLDFATIGDAVASLLLLFAESIGIFQFIVFSLTMTKPYRRPVPVWPATRTLPTIDVYIATYNEPEALLKKTIAAACAICYPSERLNVYVCDDGNRPAIQAFCQQWPVHYIARPTHDHAKAGNLNYALDHSQGEFIFILDADMIPKPDCLTALIGYFDDPLMSFVQAPQVFYNPTPFQRNMPGGRLLNNDQDFFMREMLPRRDRFNYVMFVGSNAMFSRAALKKIGGFVTGTITEDLATGLVLQAEGFHCAYADAVVATGLSAESFAEMVHQRMRWCRGNLQVFRQHNLFTPVGLSRWQRFIYLAGTIYWYVGVQKAVYVAAPVLFLLFGLISLHTNISLLAILWLPYFLSVVLTYKRLAGRKSNIWWSHVQDLALMPFIAWAAIAESLHISLKGFRVTTKGLISSHRSVSPYFWVLAAIWAVTGIAGGYS